MREIFGKACRPSELTVSPIGADQREAGDGDRDCTGESEGEEPSGPQMFDETRMESFEKGSQGRSRQSPFLPGGYV
jgi:hypothetical protein